MIAAAVLLAAGEGSRLREVEPIKPLCPVAGKPLIDHALEGLAEAGLERAVVVLGYRGEAIVSHLAARRWPLRVEWVFVDDWHAPNGVSALAGLNRAGAPALLAMCDHLVDPALYRRLACAGAGSGLTLGISRVLDDPRVDLDDVTRVATEGDRIVAIGKGMAAYDAFDTGVFAVGVPFVAALAALDRPSVSAGVTALAQERRAGVVDCGDLDWIDVDDAAALAQAERAMAIRGPSPTNDLWPRLASNR